LGGDALNQLIVDDMIKKFEEGQNLKDGAAVADLRAHGKTMARLWKESEKIRQILSANSDTMGSFEGLFHDDVKFKYKLSRSAFEQLAKDHAKRVGAPLTAALSSAKLTLDELDSIILHGGAVRTPFVQKELESICKGSSKIRTNVNADEAAVFGAAFKGAALSPSFRAKEIRTGDTPGFTVALKWNSGDKARQQKLFTPYSKIGSEKQVTLKNLEDFEFSFSQQFSRGETLIDAPILGIKTKNLTDSVTKLKENLGCVASNITTKFSFRLSPVDGLPEVVAGFVECEVQNEDKKGVVEDVKEFFGLGSKKSEQEPLEDDQIREAITLGADSSSSPSSTSADPSLAKESASASPSKGATKSSKEMKTRVESIPIAYIASPLGTPPPSISEMQRIKDRLAAFDTSDLARIQREEAINSLEAFIYRARDLVGDEGFRNCIPKEALLSLEEKLSHTSDWLYGDGLDASTQNLLDKVNELKELVDPAMKRKNEHAHRPLKVETLKQSLSSAKILLDLMQDRIAAEGDLFSASSPSSQSESVLLPSESSTGLSGALSSPSSTTTTTSDGISTASSPSETPSDDFASLDDDPYGSSSLTTATSSTESSSSSSKPSPSFSLYTPDDLSALSATYNSINTWIDTQLALQERLSDSDDPVLTVADLNAKMHELERALRRLMTKMGKQGAWEDPVGEKKKKSEKKGEKGQEKEREKAKDKSKDKKKKGKKNEVKDEL
jgi:hypoxia up-regulated 1